MNFEHNYNMSSMISDTERGLDFYAETLGVSKEDLKDKIILDLGAGKELAFAREVSSNVKGAQVFSLSPHFSDPDYKPELKGGMTSENVVAGVAQAMQFRDGQFD